MWPKPVRPGLRPEVRPPHVSRRASAGRNVGWWFLNVTLYPPAAWGSPRAFVVNSSTLGLYGVAGCFLVVFVLELLHSTRVPLCVAPMPVPATPYKPRLCPGDPCRDADVSALWQFESPHDASAAFALWERNKLPSPGLDPTWLYHTTTRRTHRQIRDNCRACVTVWSLYFFPRFSYDKQVHPSLNQALEDVPFSRHFSERFRE